MDDLVIRDLQKADIEPYLAHIVEHAVKNGIEYPEKRVETFRAVLQRIIGNASEGDALVMKNDDGIVASAMLDYFVDFSDGKTRNAEIMGVYVADEYQRRGIAGRMMDELFVRARGSGWRRARRWPGSGPRRNRCRRQPADRLRRRGWSADLPRQDQPSEHAPAP